MRQSVLFVLVCALFSCNGSQPRILTVGGEITPGQLGVCLPHEHTLVDFQREYDGEPDAFDRSEALNTLVPELEKLKKYGVKSLADCAPGYLGRDVTLLKELSERTGLQILTCTGFYGAQNNRFIPQPVLLLTADSIAKIWIGEFENGIDGTGIKPGFIKIAVNRKPLSEFHARLTRAAAIAHKATGLTIVSHCGPAVAALGQLDILKEEGVSPEAFVWTHASDEENLNLILKAAREGCWISLDKYGWDDKWKSGYPDLLIRFKEEGLLGKVLISQDAGFFDPGNPGQPFRPYTAIFDELIPALKARGLTDADIRQLTVENPANVFTLKKRLL